MHDLFYKLIKLYLSLNIRVLQTPLNSYVMNKSQLIDAIATDAGLTKVQAKKALEAFVKTTGTALKSGDKIALVGFGSFSVAKKPARTGRNPRTGQAIKIAAKKVVKFKPGAELNNIVK